jgi:hypothetical protein
MEIFGIGVHVLVALYFGYHVVRTSRPFYWLFILFAFPLFGSITYFLIIYLPELRIESGAKKVAAIASKVMDPTRELREAQAAFEYAPTAHSQSRFAAALLAAGYAEQAATNYEACLKGPFAADPAIRIGAAEAYYRCTQYEKAIAYLLAIQESDPGFRSKQIALYLALAYAANGQNDEAQSCFETAAQKFGGFEIYAEYALWSVSTGDMATANYLKSEIDELTQNWDKRTREANKVLLRRLAEVGKTR